MIVFFRFGVSALFGMVSGHRVPEKLGVGGLRSLKKPLLNSLEQGLRKFK